MTISCHQPNLIPWLPFFEKLERSDVFVFLCQPQFSKGGYQNRFRYEDKWHGLCTVKGLVPIVEKKYTSPYKDWEKLTKKFPKLKVFDGCINESLWETNTKIIMKACEILNIKTIISFDLPTELGGSLRLLDICKQHGATKYLSGPSGKSYLRENLFKEQGIEVEYFEPTDKRHLLDIL